MRSTIVNNEVKLQEYYFPDFIKIFAAHVCNEKLLTLNYKPKAPNDCELFTISIIERLGYEYNKVFIGKSLLEALEIYISNKKFGFYGPTLQMEGVDNSDLERIEDVLRKGNRIEIDILPDKFRVRLKRKRGKKTLKYATSISLWSAVEQIL